MFKMRHFIRDSIGSIFIITGLLIAILIAVSGAAYDLGKAQLIRQRAQQAADAVSSTVFGCAGTGIIVTCITSPTQQQALNTIYNLNYPADGYLDVPRPVPTISVNQAFTTVTVNSEVPTTFMKLLGINTIDVGVSSKGSANIYSYTDIVFVVDNSKYSNSYPNSMLYMAGSPNEVSAACYNEYSTPGHIYAAIPSYNSLLNYCNLPNPTVPPLPYSFSDETGTYNFNSVNDLSNWGNNRTGLYSSIIAGIRYQIHYFIQELPYMLDYNPSIGIVKVSHFVVDYVNLTDNYSDLTDALLSMYSGSEVNLSVGIDRAIQILQNGPGGNRQKAAIIIVTAPNTYPSRALADANTLQKCTELKNSGTVVFTLAIGPVINSDPAALQLLSDCATGPNGATRPNLGRTFFTTTSGSGPGMFRGYTDQMWPILNDSVFRYLSRLRRVE